MKNRCILHRHVFVISMLSLVLLVSSFRATEDNLLFKAVAWPTFFLLNIFTALKVSFIFLLIGMDQLTVQLKLQNVVTLLISKGIYSKLIR